MKLKQIGVETIGIIDINEAKRKIAIYDGLKVFDSYEEAIETKPDFWDICVATLQHNLVLKKIISLDIHANIIIEKPVCQFSQISELKKILKLFKGKIVVNENYIFSNVTQKILEISKAMDIKPTRIISEMTKNRKYDIAMGRFVDTEFYAFGYEGCHLITNVMQFGKEYLPVVIKETNHGGMFINNSSYAKYLPKQGLAEIKYVSHNGTEVILYTSMTGNIKHKYPFLFDIKNIPFWDTKTRYRILAVEDKEKDIVVVGFYEPIKGFQRSEGAVVVINNGKLFKKVAPIQDDNIGIVLLKAVNYFKGKGDNPCSVEIAMETVKHCAFCYKTELINKEIT
jgi:hypothetical protein